MADTRRVPRTTWILIDSQNRFRYDIVYTISKNPSPDQKTKKFSEHKSTMHVILNINSQNTNQYDIVYSI